MALCLSGTALGVHSNVAFALLPNEQSLLLTLGPEARVLSLSTMQMTLTLRAAQDSLVSVLPVSLQRLACVSVTGEIALFSQSGEIITRQKSNGRVLCAAGSVSCSLLALCFSVPAKVAVWSIGEKSLTLREELCGVFRFAELTTKGRVFAVKESVCPSSHSRILASAHLFDSGRETTHASLTFAESRVSAWMAEDDEIAVLFESRKLAIVEMESLRVTRVLHVDGVGVIRALWFHAHTVTLSPGSGLLTVIDAPQVADGKIDPFSSNAHGVVSVETGQDWLSTDASWIHWSEQTHRVVICDEDGVFRGEFIDYPISGKMTYTNLSMHKSGCTSACLSPAGTHLCSGDDSGQVIVWDLATSQSVSSFQMVRST